jgi:hypothetical protein
MEYIAELGERMTISIVQHADVKSYTTELRLETIFERKPCQKRELPKTDGFLPDGDIVSLCIST